MSKYDFLIAVLYGVVLIISLAIKQMWAHLNKYLEKYFEAKAENLATKQDVAEITRKTEEVQAEFHQMLEEFDTLLKFQYQFYENQYKELYSELYWKICESESLRYILVDLEEKYVPFIDVPIVEYEVKKSDLSKQEQFVSIDEEIISLIQEKHIYASPELVKLVCTLENVKNYDVPMKKSETVQIECILKAEIVETIINDYRWLRQKLHLQGDVRANKYLREGKFISILRK